MSPRAIIYIPKPLFYCIFNIYVRTMFSFADTMDKIENTSHLFGEF